MSDDFDDFIEATENPQPSAPPTRGETSKRTKSTLESLLFGDSDGKENNVTPGQLSQYALFGTGYMAAPPTVSIIPPGIYQIAVSQQGIYFDPMKPPSGMLLELPEMRCEHVIKTVEHFWNSEKNYKDGNDLVIGDAPYRSGIMLYGPPGSGKSCTIKILCRKIVERGGIVIMSSGNPEFLSGALQQLSKIEPNRKVIVVLEDIDSQVERYGESHYLQILDGAESINNAVFIATTNYPERLDPRIYNRPGRFSHVIKIGMPTVLAREAYLKAILKKHENVPEIVAGTEGFSIDHLTALINSCFREGRDLKEEMVRLRNLFKIPKANEDRKLGM